MGEMLKNEAENLKRQYIGQYEAARTNVRINFEDMDFDNAMQRDEMETLVEEVEQLCRNYEAEAARLSFS